MNAKRQITLSGHVLRMAGIRVGDTVQAEAHGPGAIRLVRVDDPLGRFAGALTGAYEAGDLDALRDEWDT